MQANTFLVKIFITMAIAVESSAEMGQGILQGEGIKLKSPPVKKMEAINSFFFLLLFTKYLRRNI